MTPPRSLATWTWESGVRMSRSMPVVVALVLGGCAQQGARDDDEAILAQLNARANAAHQREVPQAPAAPAPPESAICSLAAPYLEDPPAFRVLRLAGVDLVERTLCFDGSAGRKATSSCSRPTSPGT
jgi:hypothetical protein